MKRRIISFMTMLLCPLAVLAEEFVVDGIKYNVTSATDPLTVEVIRNNPKYSGDIVIPQKVEYNNEEYSVTSIGGDAFQSCSGLTSITIPNSVTSIGIQAFRGCSGLTAIVVEAGNTVYDSRNDCNAIIKTETNELRAGCKNTVIPNSVTSIGDFAFYGCSGLTAITIPNSVTSIGDFAFAHCSGLTSITIPSSVTSIGDFAFAHCSGLTSITIPSSVTSIGGSAFSGCSGLTSIAIPSSVTSIGGSAFFYCSGLTSIVVEAGNTVYDSRNNCNAIIKTETNELIAGCKNTVIPNTVTSIKYMAFLGCSGLTAITIPSSVTSIGDNAFSDCSGLTSVTIPSSVTSIGESAFNECSGLTSIVVEAGNTVYDSRNNCNAIIKTSDNELIAGCQNTIIPNSVTSIGDEAFFGCSGLTAITIPNSVTSIGNFAFYYCSGLTSITISSSVTSIGARAFFDCSSLTSINIPSSVTSIGDEAFCRCSGLTSITIPSSVTSIGGCAFSGCSGLTSIVVEAGNTVYDSRNDCNAIIKAETNELIAGCKNTVIPNSVTSIGVCAFEGCSGLTSVTIPSSVTSIGVCAFEGCSGLTSITIPSSVTSIGTWAFQGCSSLTSVTVGATTPIAIDSYCFTNRANATLYVPQSSKAAYEAANYWKEFKEIIEMVNVADISQIDNVLYIEPLEARSGETEVELSIKMKNTAAIRGFQFDLVLPAGVTPVTEDNEMVYWLNGDRAPKKAGGQLYHTIDVSAQDNGSYRFLCGAQQDKTFAGNDGEVVVLKVNIAEDMKVGDYPITLRDIKLTETDISNSYQTESVVSKLTIMEYEIGDISGDGVVDVSDYIGVANHILGKTPAVFNAKAADVNKDNAIDVSDYIGVANIILTGTINGKTNSAAPAMNPRQDNMREPQ